MEVKSMKAKHLVTVGMILAVVMMLGLSATGFADGGWGRGRGGYCDGPAAEDCPRGYGPRGGAGNLSDDEIALLQKERAAFFEQTREVRDDLYQKGLELSSELAKKEPDAAKAAALQKEISGLKAQLEQQALDYRLRMRKENSELYSKGFGQGRGPGWGRGMGPGYGGRGGPGNGRGPCWE
jgi:hypothetical protein